MSFRRAHGIPQRHRPVPNPALAPDPYGVVVVRLAAARRRTPGSASSSGAHRAAQDKVGPAPRGTHGVCESPDASDDTRLDLSSHRQAARLSSEGSDSRPSGPSSSGHSSTAGPGFAQRGLSPA